MPENKRTIIDISTSSILKFFGIILLLFFIFIIKDVFLLFFIVLIVVSALYPIVDRWEMEMPRSLAVVLLFLAIILGIAAASLLIIPPLVTQIGNFAREIPQYLKSLNPFLGSVQHLSSESQKTLFSLSNELSNFGKNVLDTTVGVINGVVAIITILVSSFYLLAEKKKAAEYFHSLPIQNKEKILAVVRKITEKMGAWLRGQIVLMITINIVTTVALYIVGVPYALALGVWAGLTEVIPYIGPILGAIPAILTALFISPIKGLIVLIIYILTQQLEGHVLVPKIMGKAVGLSPVIIIFAILIGAKLSGILGIIIAVPAVAVLSVIYLEYPNIKKIFNSKDVGSNE